jgi:hypothetical protein
MVLLMHGCMNKTVTIFVNVSNKVTKNSIGTNCTAKNQLYVELCHKAGERWFSVQI